MSNQFSSIDPYGGGESIDPYGGFDPEAEANAADGEQNDPWISERGPGSWRTWRIKGAFKGWRALPRVMPYLRPYRGLYVLVFILTVLASIVALAEPWPLAIMVDSVLGTEDPTSFLHGIFGDYGDYSPYALLVFVVLAGFGLTIIGHLINLLSDYAAAKLEQNLILDFRSALFKHVERLSLAFHDEKFTGQLMSIINLQASAVGSVLMAFPPILQNVLTLFGMLVIACLISWQVTLVSLVAVPLIYYATGLYGTRIVPRIRQVMSLEWRSLSIVFEAMSMLRVIVSFGREKYEHRRFRDQARTAVDARVALTVRQNVFALGVTAATALGTAAVLGFGAWNVLSGNISIGELLVLIAYIAAIYAPLEQIGTSVAMLHQQFVFMDAVLQLLDTEPEVTEAPDAVDLGRSRGEISFEDVDFAYGKRVDTLKGISFHVNPGERVAVVGPTGAGKTTLINLIVRFYDVKEGNIKIDGVDLKKIQLKSLRENIALVHQMPMLFSGSILENIRYGRLDSTLDEVMAAAKAANCHDFIMSLPGGYDTLLGEGGLQLSGGERQRICVARAFVKDAPILILDEPTSSIDSKTENVILDALDDLMAGRTSFMIAHRLSTIHDADRILVINHGELVEQGSHDELMGRGGLYAQLYNAQMRRKRGAPDGAVVERPAAGALTPTPHVRERVAAALAQAHAEAAERPQAPPAPAPVGAGPNGAQGGNGGPNGPPRTVVKIPHVRKELHCDVCGRTLLKGEVAEPFLAPPSGRKKNHLDSREFDGPFLTDFRSLSQTDHKLVCELCWPYAEEQGWTALPALGGPT
jgi:ABC-type multidrug transport system fused ATPase/permease subunit